MPPRKAMRPMRKRHAKVAADAAAAAAAGDAVDSTTEANGTAPTAVTTEESVTTTTAETNAATDAVKQEETTETTTEATTTEAVQEVNEEPATSATTTDAAAASPFQYVVTDNASAESVAASAAAIALSALVNNDSQQSGDDSGTSNGAAMKPAVEAQLQEQLQAYMEEAVSSAAEGVVAEGPGGGGGAAAVTAAMLGTVAATEEVPLVYTVDHQEAPSSTQLSMLDTALLPKPKFKASNGTGVGGGNGNGPAKKRKTTAGGSGTPTNKNYIANNVPTENDVLMGRGGRSNHHPGNARYLQEKLKIQERYRKASKEEKTGISQELVDTVRQWGGRFLKMDGSVDKWYEVDNTTARKKASQTLREDNTPERRAEKRAKYGGAGGTPKQPPLSSAINTGSALAALAKPTLTPTVGTTGLEVVVAAAPPSPARGELEPQPQLVVIHQQEEDIQETQV